MQKTLKYIHDSQDLTEKNFFLFAAKHYENNQCHDVDEFYQDLLIPMHLKKLFTRYHTNSVLKDRLIVNHVISFFNVFEPRAACKILFFKMEEKYYSYLKTVLVFLNRCPEYMLINGSLIDITAIPVDADLLKLLEDNQKKC